ncbi:MAG: hypothetical protein ABMA64_20680 [Myxococcota bacterium]
MPENGALRLLSIVIPGILSAFCLWFLGRPPDPLDRSPQAIEMDEGLAETNPELVLLGDSMAGRNLNAERLGRGLGGVPFDATVPGTTAPIWYVVLKDRVYAGGYTPSTVVVASSVEHLLTVAPESAWDRMSLASWSNGIDPAVELRMSGGRSAGGSWISARAAGLRNQWVDGYRDQLVGALFAPLGEGTVAERGRELVQRSAGAVFGQGGSSAGSAESGAPLAHPGESFVADFVDLAESHQSRIVFVLLPIREGSTTRGTDELRRELTQWLDDRGAMFVDLTRASRSASDFVDRVHMTPEAAMRTTEALIESIAAGGDHAAATARIVRAGEPAPVPIAGAPTRLGPCVVAYPAPALAPIATPALERVSVPGSPLVVRVDGAPLGRAASEPLGCDGEWFVRPDGTVVIATSEVGVGVEHITLSWSDELPQEVDLTLASRAGGVTPVRYVGTLLRRAGVWWALPGTSLEIPIPEGTTAVSTSAVGLGGTEPPSLWLDDRRVNLSREARVYSVDRLEVQGARTLRWTAPADGPWLVLRHVASLVPDGPPDFLVGTELTSAASVPLLPVPGAPVTVSYAGPPPPIVQAPAQQLDRLAAQIDIDSEWVSLSALKELTASESCVPVRLSTANGMIDGRARDGSVSFNLPAPDAVAVWQPGRRCTWYPTEPTREELGLTGLERRNRDRRKSPPPAFFEWIASHRWLLPGDRATLSRPSASGLQGIAHGLRVRLFRPGTVREVHLALSVAGMPYGEWTVPVEAGPRFEQVVPLSAAIGVKDGPVVLEARSDGFVILTELSLVETRP